MHGEGCNWIYGIRVLKEAGSYTVGRVWNRFLPLACLSLCHSYYGLCSLSTASATFPFMPAVFFIFYFSTSVLFPSVPNVSPSFTSFHFVRLSLIPGHPFLFSSLSLSLVRRSFLYFTVFHLFVILLLCHLYLQILFVSFPPFCSTYVRTCDFIILLKAMEKGLCSYTVQYLHW